MSAIPNNVSAERKAAFSDALAKQGLFADIVADGTLIFKSPLSAAQETLVQAMISTFDFRVRTKRTIEQLRTAINILSNNDRSKLTVAVIAKFLQDYPRFALEIGIQIEGDEAI